MSSPSILPIHETPENPIKLTGFAPGRHYVELRPGDLFIGVDTEDPNRPLGKYERVPMGLLEHTDESVLAFMNYQRLSPAEKQATATIDHSGIPVSRAHRIKVIHIYEEHESFNQAHLTDQQFIEIAATL